MEKELVRRLRLEGKPRRRLTPLGVFTTVQCRKCKEVIMYLEGNVDSIVSFTHCDVIHNPNLSSIELGECYMCSSSSARDEGYEEGRDEGWRSAFESMAEELRGKITGIEKKFKDSIGAAADAINALKHAAVTVTELEKGTDAIIRHCEVEARDT